MIGKLRAEFSKVAERAYRKYLDWYFAPMAIKPSYTPYPMSRNEFIYKSGLDKFGAFRTNLDGDWVMGPHTGRDIYPG